MLSLFYTMIIMKSLNLIFALFLISTFSFAIAQNAPVVKEETTSFGKISGNSLVIIIPEATLSSVEKEWKSLLKDYGGKPKGSKGIITAENVVINTMGEEKLHVLTKIISVAEGVQLSVAFANNDKFITSSNNSIPYSAAENLLHNFALRMARKGVEVKKSDSKNELSVLERQKNNLDKKQKQLQRDIERWEDNIKKAQKEIEENKKELENLNNSINAKIEQINIIKDRESEINKME